MSLTVPFEPYVGQMERRLGTPVPITDRHGVRDMPTCAHCGRRFYPRGEGHGRSPLCQYCINAEYVAACNPDLVRGLRTLAREEAHRAVG